MKIDFKRITSSAIYIPEIDGLRFIAITSVVLFHLRGVLVSNNFNQNKDQIDFSFLNNLLSHGHYGVPLFFSISGLILGIPFAKFYIANGPYVYLKKYYFRRLTRLEPPYILSLTIFFVGAVFLAKRFSFSEGFESYLASLIYSHNIIFPNTLPRLNGVCWSLEVEIQFYILAPLMALVFKIKASNLRRFSLIAISILLVVFNKCDLNPIKFMSLVNYLQYFTIGLLMADIYISQTVLLQKTKYDTIIGLFFFLLFWLFDDVDFDTTSKKLIWELIQIICIFFFYYYILMHKIFSLLSTNLITNIGGMCYSIYLIHNQVIRIFGNILLKYSFSKYSFINITLISFVLLVLVLAISSIFYLLIERPCMRENWFKNLIKKN